MEIASAGQSGMMGPSITGNADQNDRVISSDFDTFIKMLTAQIRNQDPLNPMDSADFAVQLATFSSVEQQVKTNDLLAELGRQVEAQSVGQLSGWIGMEARAVMPVVFDGKPVTMTLKGADLADKLELVVKNVQGNEIQRIDVPTGAGSYLWAGEDTLGNTLPNGSYTITTQSISQGTVVLEEPVEVHARVVEASSIDGKLKLIMENGQNVAASDVLGLRQPPS